MKITIRVIFISLILTGCHFSKSVKKDLVSGLTTAGNLITCNDVYLSVDDKRTSRNSFIYGEKIFMNYDDIQGFTKVNGNVFPAMSLIVTDMPGDTIMYNEDLYSNFKDGLNYNPLKLIADLTIASPVRSGNEYNLSVKISDKKGTGTFSSKFKFSVKHDDKIAIDAKDVKYDEIYLYSRGNEKVITDGKIKFGDEIYVIIEGLKGFKEENGLVFPGLSLSGTDSGNSNILNYSDMFSEYTETGLSESDFFSRVSAHFKLLGSKLNNPMHIVLYVWDKKSEARLKVLTNVTVE